MKLFLRIGFFLFAAAMVSADDPAEIRAAYVPTFDTNTQARADAIIAEVLTGNINQLYVQVRARGDAYYYPNREDSTYPNPEPRGQLYTISPSDLDVLQYYIDRLHNATPRREVHAWLTTYNSWNRSTPPASSSHVYFTHPEWVTETTAGVTYDYNDDAPLDPGIPGVQDYLYNVFMDVVRNYDVDGVHFDYIRLLGTNSGYDPAAKAAFLAQTGWNYDTQNTSNQLSEVYEAWRRDQVAKLVQRVHTQTMLEKPWVEVSAFLVNFTDSVENLAQGYNWWVRHGAIDVLHPSAYSSTVSGGVADYNFTISKLNAGGDANTRPIAVAIGSYLYHDATPSDNAQAVLTLRGNARVPDGFNFFTHDSLYKDGTPANQMAQDLFNTGGPMDDWAPVPTMAHKLALGEETTAPNAPASASVALMSGRPLVTFNRPAAAADGDLPVHYRLYRDSDASVDLHYSNMVMEWWDLASSRSSFSFDDMTASGTTYYSIVAYDNWNNRAAVIVGPVTASAVNEFIVETRSGGLNYSAYSEVSGSTFTDSSSHSTATGLTGSLGSRFALPGDANGRNDKARFSANSLATGSYNVFVTCFNFASANAQGITVRFNDAGGISTSTTNLTSANAGNVWYQVGSLNVTNGAGHYVEFDNTTQTNIGDSTNSRMNAAAVRFVRTGLSNAAKEPKPAVVAAASSVTELIIDSDPPSLDYDDDGSSGKWASSTLAGYYNSNARFYSSANFPVTAVATWVIDLPRAGQWAIDGWVRNNTSFADSAQYRFVDANNIVRNVVTTQRTGTDSTTTGGWFINVDGVTDANAYSFNKGRVYVTLYGNQSGSQTLIADALRLRYVGSSSAVDGWMLY